MVLDEAARKAVVERLRQHREEVRRQVESGQLQALPDLTDDELGAEAVRLVKESRRKRRRGDPGEPE